LSLILAITVDEAAAKLREAIRVSSVQPGQFWPWTALAYEKQSMLIYGGGPTGFFGAGLVWTGSAGVPGNEGDLMIQ